MRFAHRALMALSTAVALVPTSGCHIDMWRQPKLKPQREAQFFSDGASSRRPVPGTIARGHLPTDDVLHTGASGGELSRDMPFPVTAEVLERGRHQFDIHCAPCHGPMGYGNGMVAQRGLSMRRPPASYHTDRLRAMPIGHFFDAITNGYGVMFSAASRVAPRDRWCIAAHIRVLQLSQHAKLSDLTSDERAMLGAERGSKPVPPTEDTRP